MSVDSEIRGSGRGVIWEVIMQRRERGGRFKKERRKVIIKVLVSWSPLRAAAAGPHKDLRRSVQNASQKDMSDDCLEKH